MSEPFQTNNIRGLKPNPSAVPYKQNHSLTALSLDLLEKAFLGKKQTLFFPNVPWLTRISNQFNSTTYLLLLRQPENKNMQIFLISVLTEMIKGHQKSIRAHSM